MRNFFVLITSHVLTIVMFFLFFILVITLMRASVLVMFGVGWWGDPLNSHQATIKIKMTKTPKWLMLYFKKLCLIEIKFSTRHFFTCQSQSYRHTPIFSFFLFGIYMKISWQKIRHLIFLTDITRYYYIPEKRIITLK